MSRRRRQKQTGISLFAFQDIITCVMGIMLLLTLILCLQITTAATPEFAPQQTLHDMEVQASRLADEVSTLIENVEKQRALIDSGALGDPALLRDRATVLESDIERASQDVTTAQDQHDDSSGDLAQLKSLESERRSELLQTQQLQTENDKMAEQIRSLSGGSRVIYNAHNSTSSTCWLIEMKSPDQFLAAELGHSGPPASFGSASQLDTWITTHSSDSFLLLVKPSSADAFENLSEDLRQRGIKFGFDLLPESGTAIDPQTGAAL